jgi:hypothetical protein
MTRDGGLLYAAERSPILFSLGLDFNDQIGRSCRCEKTPIEQVSLS